jgi:hypothetical protein
MNQFPLDDQFNCSVGCESANQCEYYNDLPASQVIPQMQNYVESGNYYFNNNYDDGIVLSNIRNSINQQVQTFQNYSNTNEMQQTPGYISGQSLGYSGGNFFTDNAQTYPPCQGPKPWNFAQCYGYYGEAPCQYTNVVDMEDFM